MTLVVAAALMLAICVAQLVLWQGGYAIWLGRRPGDLRTETRVSWLLHLFSYPVVLAVMAVICDFEAYPSWALGVNRV